VRRLDKAFGARLSEAQAARGLSSPALAEVLGVSRQLVYQWRSGVAPALRHRRDLVAALQVNGGWLFGSAGPEIDAGEAEELTSAALATLLSAATSSPRPGRLLGSAVARLYAAIDRLEVEDEIEAWGLALGEEVAP
jgi:transcriptional regulator with XRE-family HTH domain